VRFSWGMVVRLSVSGPVTAIPQRSPAGSTCVTVSGHGEVEVTYVFWAAVLTISRVVAYVGPVFLASVDAKHVVTMARQISGNSSCLVCVLLCHLCGFTLGAS
jgi:hypothetical protein